MCQYGQGVVRQLFREVDAEKLKGFSIWLPVMDGDNEESALAGSMSFLDERIEHNWDSKRRFGKSFAKMLNLKGLAWDVYLLYAPGVTWTDDQPPEPTFWMHQLPAETGADGKLILNPGKFASELLNLFGEGDLRKAWDMAFILHLNGLNALRKEGIHSSMDDVLEVVSPSQEGSETDEK